MYSTILSLKLDVVNFDYHFINSDYDYPIHSFIILDTKNPKDFYNLFNRIGLFPKDNGNKEFDTSIIFKPYTDLWSVYGHFSDFKDTLFIEENYMGTTVYAGYLNRNGLITKAYNPQICKGKVIAFINSNRCYIIIEELIDNATKVPI